MLGGGESVIVSQKANRHAHRQTVILSCYINQIGRLFLSSRRERIGVSGGGDLIVGVVARVNGTSAKVKVEWTKFEEHLGRGRHTGSVWRNLRCRVFVQREGERNGTGRATVDWRIGPPLPDL